MAETVDLGRVIGTTGPAGPTGPTGPTGPQGDTGPTGATGLPVGGNPGDVLVKKSDVDYESSWASPFVLRHVTPVFDDEKGCYDNESVRKWIESRKNGKQYGVRIPDYATDPTSEGVRIGDSVGMVIEPSTNLSVGQNDWDSTAVGFCVRCNVDMDDTNYQGTFKITSIEGIDDRFNTENNTFSIRCNNFYKVERNVDGYQDIYVSDTQHDGYKPFPLTDEGVPAKEGFHLTACYMDSDCTMNSQSGRAPSSYYQADDGTGAGQGKDHSDDHDAGFKNDTYTYMSYADIFEQIVLMQVMLGVKVPKSVVRGNIDGSVSGITLSDVSEDGYSCKSNKEIPKGMCLMASNSSSSYNSSRSNVVISCTESDDGTFNITCKYPNLSELTQHLYSVSYSLVNGYCDNVMGTFGTPTEAGLTNNKESFKFMNVEWNTGFYETVANLIHHGGNDTVGYNPINGGPEVVSETVPINSSKYVGDYTISEEGILIPTSTGTNSTTGYRVYGYFSASFDCKWYVGGSSSNSSFFGVGCVSANGPLSVSVYYRGGRASTLGGNAT